MNLGDLSYPIEIVQARWNVGAGVGKASDMIDRRTEPAEMRLTGYTENDGIVTLTFQKDDSKEITLEFPGCVVPSEQIEAERHPAAISRCRFGLRKK